MKILKIMFLTLSVLFGVFLIVYGEKDDSPGAQFLGLIIAITCIISIFRRTKE